MAGRSALNILEADGPQLSSISAVGLMNEAVSAYAWRRPAPHLSAAVERSLSLRYTIIKRALDILLSGILLILFAPVGLLVALAVALTSPGPVFYRQERLGRFGAPFRIIKFRSMYARQHKDNVLGIDGHHHLNHAAYPLAKEGPDPRITPVGRVIRKLSLDELPQLLNVLLGDMSLVGPRPIVEAERRLYGQHFAYYDLFCPGITGLWQVSGRSDVAFDKRVLLDREYASEWSCLLDFKILTRTIPAVVTMKGAY
jgi:lipopolysaccharide/colanic/teichoic acid biosynthesis glycosyltransferase